jgi:transposase-like protein
VQSAVLASPKLTDPEVETFAGAKNLAENVFREIARNRRFMKNYHVVRNLVQNPRTPLDIALPLVKMLLVYDLKGMQHSRTISETIRKMAQKYYKEKALSGGKTKD